ncbi:MAG: hypothetical protein ACYCYP_09200 [Leptospirales bacterium]
MTEVTCGLGLRSWRVPVELRENATIRRSFPIVLMIGQKSGAGQFSIAVWGRFNLDVVSALIGHSK